MMLLEIKVPEQINSASRVSPDSDAHTDTTYGAFSKGFSTGFPYVTARAGEGKSKKSAAKPLIRALPIGSTFTLDTIPSWPIVVCL